MALLDDVFVVMDKPAQPQTAFARALALQDLGRGHLTLAAFVYHPMADNADAFETHQRRAVRQALLHERTEWLRGVVLDAGASARNLSVEVTWAKDFSRAVTEAVSERRASVVVKSVHHSETLLHTPADWRLLRDCPAPLLLVTGRPWRRKPVILATLDLARTDRRHTALNRRVLDAAVALAAAHGGLVHVVHAIEISEVLRDLDIIDSRKAIAQARVKSGRALDKLLAPYGIPPARIHLPAGKVGPTVVRTATRTKADLVVLGTTARKGVRGFVIGNTAERILTRIACDVLALKP